MDANGWGRGGGIFMMLNQNINFLKSLTLKIKTNTSFQENPKTKEILPFYKHRSANFECL